MKVILLAPTPPPAGGIAGWTLRMQKASLKNGWKVVVVDEKLKGNRQVFGDKNKKNLIVEIHRCFSIWHELIKKLKDDEVKVVHSCIPAGTTGMMREYVCSILSKIYRKKFVIHYRCTLPNMVKNRIGLTIFKLLSNISDLVIVLNSTSMDFAKIYSETNVKLIPNFIEESAIISNRVISEKINTILYVGGVIESKGCHDIIKVAEKFPQIEFRLVGNAEENISKMNKPRNVILLGEKSKSEVKYEMDKADLFMFVTYFPGEGFSNALAEAMATGLPCIVSDWAANKDMVEDKGGIVVPIKDINSMISAIRKLEYNKYLRLEESEWNIRKVKSKYTDKIITSIYVDEYEKLLKRKY